MKNLKYFLRTQLYALRSYPRDLFIAVLDVSQALVGVIGTILAPFAAIVPALAYQLHRRAPRFWAFLFRSKLIRDAMTKRVARSFGRTTQPRPHPYSMMADYPSWPGLVDRRFTGRHLGPKPQKELTPDEELAFLQELENLFLRPLETGAQVNDIRSNVLFASFAQWFTDSFLRTSHNLHYNTAGNTVEDTDGTLKRTPGREKTNDSNHEIDLCQIYGMNERETNILRIRPGDPDYDPENHKGHLRSQFIDGEEFPAQLLQDAPSHNPDGTARELSFQPEFKDLYRDEKLVRSIFSKAKDHKDGHSSLFACGLEHGNATIGNSLFNTLFLRQHNRVADLIAEAHPDMDDEQVFQTTRNVMIVLLLKIVICDYVRHISPMDLPFTLPLKMGDRENWYRRNRIHIEFNLLYRWHGLVPDVFPFLPDLDQPAKNFSNFRHNNRWLTDTGVADTVRHFMATPAGMMTLGNTPRALRMVKRDTLKLMRASKLDNYNAYRERFGLMPAKSFEDVTGEAVVSSALSDLYDGDIEQLDFYVGMVAERHGPGQMMGELMFRMVAHDALTHAITNPLLSDEMHEKRPGFDYPGEHVFSRVGLEVISEIETLDDFIRPIVPGFTSDEAISFRANPDASPTKA